jgi:hypothetical protein
MQKVNMIPVSNWDWKTARLYGMAYPLSSDAKFNLPNKRVHDTIYGSHDGSYQSKPLRSLQWRHLLDFSCQTSWWLCLQWSVQFSLNLASIWSRDGTQPAWQRHSSLVISCMRSWQFISRRPDVFWIVDKRNYTASMKLMTISREEHTT